MVRRTDGGWWCWLCDTGCLMEGTRPEEQTRLRVAKILQMSRFEARKEIIPMVLMLLGSQALL